VLYSARLCHMMRGGAMRDEMNASGPDRLMTPQEVSDLLQVSVYTVRRWINQGELPAYKVGRVWRLRRSDVTAWLNRRTPDRKQSQER